MIIIIIALIVIAAVFAATLSANWLLCRFGITNEETRGIYPVLSLLLFFCYLTAGAISLFSFIPQGKNFIHKFFIQPIAIAPAPLSEPPTSSKAKPEPSPEKIDELSESSMPDESNGTASQIAVTPTSAPSKVKSEKPSVSAPETKTDERPAGSLMPEEISSSVSSEPSIKSDAGEPQEEETPLQQEPAAIEPSYQPTSEDHINLSSPQPTIDIPEKKDSVDTPPPLIKPEATKKRVQVTAAPIPPPKKQQARANDSCKKINEYMDSQDKKMLSDIKRGIAPTDHWENPINKSRYLVIPEARQNGSQCSWLIDATINGKNFICHDSSCN